jgi:small-conductance mechanosensitive channel
MRVITVFRELAINHYKSETETDFSLRKAKTKFHLIQRVLNFLIILGTIAIILMTFKSIRSIGSSLLASAGVVGLVLGFAAQKSLSTLFAGIQIAISQPIRIDDVVVIDDSFGTIGEITLTYVVVNSWDGRRIIVPINFFIEKSFENWTRVSSDVIGKVKFYADYSLPVEKVRTEFTRLLSASPLWDKRASGFLVTDANDKTIELRATMSARNSDDAWDLQCYIREKLITYISSNFPEALPKTRSMPVSMEPKLN